jgi:hypothetical protein
VFVCMVTAVLVSLLLKCFSFLSVISIIADTVAVFACYTFFFSPVLTA